MKIRAHNFLPVSIYLLSASMCFGQIELPKIISSNMVLQRDANVKIWGWSAKNEKISLTASWITKTLTSNADKNGRWEFEVKTTLSKDAQAITLSDSKSEKKLNNILFGEVWLCSGQSNMEMTLTGYVAQPTKDGLQAIVHSGNPNLRLFTVERSGSDTPKDSLGAVRPWAEANPENVAEFSAVAYFFGSQLQEILDVPVGLIHSSWGGSKIQAWMPDELASQYESYNLNEVDWKNPRVARRTPTILFNAMINPILNYTIKGTLWYQGESNRTEAEKYREMLPAMVSDWRKRFESGEFPFYYVQIAPFYYRKDALVYDDDRNSAYIREVQSQLRSEIPNSGVAILSDIGDSLTNHPPFKKQVGDRLLYQALSKTYGYSWLDSDGPAYKSIEIMGDSALINFDYAERGLYAPNGLSNFEIAGEDKVFYPAEASIFKSHKVLVKSDKVAKPVAVRYGWSNYFKGTLFDTSYLPASTFRTDNWEDAINAATLESNDK